MKKLKYSFEYFCSPFWIEEINKKYPIYENIDTQKLPINNYLLNEINELNELFQSTYNDIYPPEPLHSDLFHKLIFTNRVVLSYYLLRLEVEKRYELIFDIQYWENQLINLKKHLQL